MNDLQPIETRYKGFRFRSRAEARWAVFFDAANVRFVYEPEAYALGDGLIYLPDFYLPNLGVWFEVKGPADADLTKPWKLQERLYDSGSPDRVVVAYGQMPDPATLTIAGHPEADMDHQGRPIDPAFDLMVSGDYHYAWCVCPWCGKAGVEFDARGARVCGWRAHHETVTEAMSAVADLGHWHEDKCYTGNHPTIAKAYAAARSARFEFGESGAG